MRRLPSTSSGWKEIRGNDAVASWPALDIRPGSFDMPCGADDPPRQNRTNKSGSSTVEQASLRVKGFPPRYHGLTYYLYVVRAGTPGFRQTGSERGDNQDDRCFVVSEVHSQVEGLFTSLGRSQNECLGWYRHERLLQHTPWFAPLGCVHILVRVGSASVSSVSIPVPRALVPDTF